MASKSDIEWTNASWTAIRARLLSTGKTGWHCEKVSPACANCYAELFNGRMLPNGGTGLDYTVSARDQVEIFLDEDILMWPLTWKKGRKIFVCSMTDLFADFVPLELIDQIFAVMALCPQHTFQVLTKRPKRMREYLTSKDVAIRWLMAAREWLPDIKGISSTLIETGDGLQGGMLNNVWLGVSAENQKYADERIPLLLQTPAAVRFVSYEPALGPIDFTFHISTPRGLLTRGTPIPGYPPRPVLNWIIAGGESGPGARLSHPDWFRSVRDQCQAAGVAFHFKQWGQWSEFYDRDRDDPDWANVPKEKEGVRRINLEGGCGFHGDRVVYMRRMKSKEAAGRILDGRTWDEFPDPVHGGIDLASKHDVKGSEVANA